VVENRSQPAIEAVLIGAAKLVGDNRYDHQSSIFDGPTYSGAYQLDAAIKQIMDHVPMILMNGVRV